MDDDEIDFDKLAEEIHAFAEKNKTADDETGEEETPDPAVDPYMQLRLTVLALKAAGWSWESKPKGADRPEQMLGTYVTETHVNRIHVDLRTDPYTAQGFRHVLHEVDRTEPGDPNSVITEVMRWPQDD